MPSEPLQSSNQDKTGEKKRNSGGSVRQRAWAVTGVGFELAGTVGACCIAGYFLDRWLDSAPWGLLAGAVLGIVLGMFNLIRLALKVYR